MNRMVLVFLTLIVGLSASNFCTSLVLLNNSPNPLRRGSMRPALRPSPLYALNEVVAFKFEGDNKNDCESVGTITKVGGEPVLVFNKSYILVVQADLNHLQYLVATRCLKGADDFMFFWIRESNIHGSIP